MWLLVLVDVDRTEGVEHRVQQGRIHGGPEFHRRSLVADGRCPCLRPLPLSSQRRQETDRDKEYETFMSGTDNTPCS